MLICQRRMHTQFCRVASERSPFHSLSADERRQCLCTQSHANWYAICKRIAILLFFISPFSSLRFRYLPPLCWLIQFHRRRQRHRTYWTASISRRRSFQSESKSCGAVHWKRGKYAANMRVTINCIFMAVLHRVVCDARDSQRDVTVCDATAMHSFALINCCLSTETYDCSIATTRKAEGEREIILRVESVAVDDTCSMTTLLIHVGLADSTLNDAVDLAILRCWQFLFACNYQHLVEAVARHSWPFHVCLCANFTRLSEVCMFLNDGVDTFVMLLIVMCQR